jgi:hypothetical protein
MEFLGSDLDSVDVVELLVATADHADPLIDPVVAEVLALVRDKLGLEVVFAHELRPVDLNWEFADAGAAHSDSVEASWGRQQLATLQVTDTVEGCHQCAPVNLADGRRYGTLCAFSRNRWTAPTDLRTLIFSARLIAQKMLPVSPHEYEGLMEQAPQPVARQNGSQPTGFSAFPQPWY